MNKMKEEPIYAFDENDNLVEISEKPTIMKEETKWIDTMEV